MRASRLLPRSLTLLLVASLAALTCDDARPVAPLAEKFAEAFCEHQLNCCSPYELSVVTSERYKTVDECLTFATIAAREQLSAVEGDLQQGRISIDEAGLETCLEAYRKSACGIAPSNGMYPQQLISAVPNLALALAACPNFLIGHVPYDRACGLAMECQSGSRCLPEPLPTSYPYPGQPTEVRLVPSAGVCVAYQKEGEPCNDSTDCDPDHSCRVPEFVCGPRSKEGEACSSTVDPTKGLASTTCDEKAGLYCDTNFTFTCRHHPLDGEPCSQLPPLCDPDPALGLTCNPFSGICKKPGKEGDPCGAPAIPPCREGLACHPAQPDGIGQCGALPALGEPCTDRCASPGLCSRGICSLPGKTAIGDPCTSDEQCTSLSCSGFVNGRQACAPNGIMPLCVGAEITPGNISGFGGNFGGAGMGGVGGSTTTGRAGGPSPRGGAGGATGGVGGGTGGAAGSGPPPPLGCLFSDIAAGDPLIADFNMSDGSTVLPIGGIFTYAAPDPGESPVATITNGVLHVTAVIKGSTSAQYWGVGIYFNGDASGTDCVDASLHTGVRFDISGTIDGVGCSAQYATNDSVHLEATVDPKGAGPAGAYPPQAPLMISTTPTTQMMPFFGTGAPVGGNPAVGIDRSRLTGVQWQFTAASGTDGGTGCNVDITIDNVSFF
jgi:hypothetical protein